MGTRATVWLEDGRKPIHIDSYDDEHLREDLLSLFDGRVPLSVEWDLLAVGGNLHLVRKSKFDDHVLITAKAGADLAAIEESIRRMYKKTDIEWRFTQCT